MLILGTVAAVLLVPATSFSVSIQISAPGVGPLTSGVGVSDATGLSEIAVLVALSETTAISAYDLTVSWDASEVSLTSAANLFNPGSIAFVSPVGGDPAGARIADLALSTLSTTNLFELTFSVLSPLVADGSADISVFFSAALNGDPFSPVSVSLDNPAGAGIDVVPEPAAASLLAVALGLTALRARARRA